MARSGGGRGRTDVTPGSGEAAPPGYRPSPAQAERIAYRRRQTIRSVLVAAASTGVLGTLLVVAVVGSPGWDRVRESFLDPEIAAESLPAILDGLWLNVRLLVFCALGSLALGLVVAILRTLRGPVFFPVRAAAAGYTYAFRGLPLIIVLYVMAFGIPGLELKGTPPVLVLGGAALVVTYGAYLAEVFRAGIESIHPSQLAAARSLGLPVVVVRRPPPPPGPVVATAADALGWLRALRSPAAR